MHDGSHCGHDYGRAGVGGCGGGLMVGREIHIELTPDNIAVIEGDQTAKHVCDSRRLDVWAEALEKLRPYIPVGGTVIDVGAYIGDHTATFLNMVGDTGKVIAFEPNPVAFECLRRNLGHHANLVKMQCALGHCHQWVSLVLDSGDLSACRVVGDDKGKVTMTTMDTITQTLTRLDFLKIDAEGYEPLILNAAKLTLTRFRPAILIEMNPFMLGKYGFEVHDVEWRLERLGYVSASNFGGDGNYTDILYVPNERGER